MSSMNPGPEDEIRIRNDANTIVSGAAAGVNGPKGTQGAPTTRSPMPLPVRSNKRLGSWKPKAKRNIKGRSR